MFSTYVNVLVRREEEARKRLQQQKANQHGASQVGTMALLDDLSQAPGPQSSSSLHLRAQPVQSLT